MIEEAIVNTHLISTYLNETNFRGKKTKKMPEINVGTIFRFDKETKEYIYYGEIKDIIKTKKFKKWCKNKLEEE